MSYHNIETLSQRAEVTENLCYYQNRLEALQTDLFLELSSTDNNFCSNLSAFTCGKTLGHSATELTSFFHATRTLSE